MEYTYDFFEKSARYVREKLNFQPEIGMILGSSLGPFAAQVEDPVVIPYEAQSKSRCWILSPSWISAPLPCRSCRSCSKRLPCAFPSRCRIP